MLEERPDPSLQREEIPRRHALLDVVVEVQRLVKRPEQDPRLLGDRAQHVLEERVRLR